jgi:hypothetical protein
MYIVNLHLIVGNWEKKFYKELLKINNILESKYYMMVNYYHTINNFQHKNNYHLLSYLMDHIKDIPHSFHHIANNN